MKTIYFSSYEEAKAYANSIGGNCEASSTKTEHGEDFCYRVYNDDLLCTHKLIVNEKLWQEQPEFDKNQTL